jgi:hypothetical protein
MALSNRDRVDRGFLDLRAGLNAFIDSVANTPNWDVVLSQVEGKVFKKSDVQTHLVMLTQRFDQYFKAHLSYMARTYANELREFRNNWAHQEPFTSDDTYRMLDSAERLLLECGQPEQAEKLRKSRMEHQRLAYEAEVRKQVKDAQFVSVAGAGIKPWREVVRPHADVATGQYTAAEFAADLHMVALGEAAGEYQDPEEFFARTYLTEGLKDLLGRAAARLSGDPNASPVANLQTNFGGGKTHSMLALYHLASGTPVTEYPQEVQEVLAGVELPPSIARVAVVGGWLPPGHATKKPDGTVVRTMWGEIAWQLGGRAAFDVIADADATSTNPGDGLRRLLAEHSPALILIDEWVAYARQLYGREGLPGGSFDTQFTFAQTLTEAAKAVPGVLVVISIPASSDHTSDPEGAGGSHSSLEVGGANGVEALKRLQNVVRRVADQWRPATAHESFEIVRRRLFEPPDAAASRDIAAVARSFFTFYNNHSGEFPRDVLTGDYERRIRDCYPIHPELFDRLYEDWSTLERFQRTRGVLRLMSTVVHALWEAADAGPLIMAGSVPLNVAKVASELTQYLPDSWKPIVDADVDGEGSTPARIDREKPLLGQRSMTRRLARTIFIGSAPTVGGPHKGMERPRVWLGTALPGDTIGNFGSAIDLLGHRATYFYIDGTRYWFDTQASVTRAAADIADRLREHPEDVWVEIVRRLSDREGRARGDFAGVHIAPASTGDVPDTDAARLVILGPQYPHKRGATDSKAMQFCDQLMTHRGAGQRVNRNMIVMLAPDAARVEELSDAVREYLAWDNIHARIEDMNLTPQQANQVRTRRTGADQTVNLRIPATYHWVIVPAQHNPAAPADLEVVKAEGAQDKLAERVSAKLRQTGMIATGYAPRSIRLELDGPLKSVWATGHIRVADLWAYYCKYPYLMRLRDRNVLDDAVAHVLNELTWEREGFALANSYDPDTGTYTGLTLPSPSARPDMITDNTLLVAPQTAKAQPCPNCGQPIHTGPCQPAPEPDQPEGQPGSHPGARTKTQPGPPSNPGTGAGITTIPDKSAPPTVFLATAQLSPDFYGRDFARISQEILARLGPAQLEVTIEIRATNPDGFTPETIRTVTENARTLKLGDAGFQE